MRTIKTLLILLLAVPLQAQPGKPSFEALNGFLGIKGQVLNQETKKPLSARIVVKDSQGKVQVTYYELFDGIFTEEDGTFSMLLKPGAYTLKVTHGIDFLTQEHSFNVTKDQGVNVIIQLKPWVDLKKRGWVNGDGHAHLYSEIPANDTMLRQVRKICLAQGVDFISACQGWAGYNDATWNTAYAKVSDDRFNMYYGAEMPKYRTSHTWWLGLKSTLNNFGNLIDSTYENEYYKSEQHSEWDYSWLKFKSVPDIEVISRYARSQQAMAIIPHPTSWWWQERGTISKYTTNVVSNLSFGLLSGNIWNGMAVMGYLSDNYFYQNIWFNVLNQGYIIPPLAELDGGYPRDNKFYYGSLRTYFLTDPNVKVHSVDQIADAVKKGHTFVTSGPIIFADIDKTHQIGDVIPIDSNAHQLNIQVYASGEADDYLSYVVIFRNGKIYRLWDLRQKQPREFKETLEIKEDKHAWYLVKVYGKQAWKDTADLDVMQHCLTLELAEEIQTFPGGKFSVAFTSPFYFRNRNEGQPKPLVSKTDLAILDPKTKKPIRNCRIDVFVAGEHIDSLMLNDGKGQFRIPINALLKISAVGHETITRSLYVDYPPYLKIIEKIANGKWMEENNWKKTLIKGDVPWSVFEFEKTKSILSNVKWEIKLEPNEREGLWEDFDKLFKK
ncbi:MAG: hypothetical protein ABIN80_14285 [Dyadobacter sp.]|uniref:hypothetical protein n=1 Tax=Dyadobacter sp. TaxID=1914288 RepID=UPI003264AD01